MKIRIGFVSNSSSSSFVVLYKDYDDNILLSEEDKEKVLQYGFWGSNIFYPDQVERTKLLQDIYSYIYDVNCNEDEVLDFLVENDISFRANCHYDHFTVMYTKGSNKIISLKNFGSWWLTYEKFNKRFGRTIEEIDSTGIKIIDKEKFLTGKEYYNF